MATQDPDQIQLFKPRIHISSDMKKEMIHAFYGGLDNSKPPKMTIHQLAETFYIPLRKATDVIYKFNKFGKIEVDSTPKPKPLT